MNKITRRDFLSKLCLLPAVPFSLGLLNNLPGCSSNRHDAVNKTAVKPTIDKPEVRVVEPPRFSKLDEESKLPRGDLSQVNKVTLMAVGDIMMHATIIKAAYDQTSKVYDYYPYFEYVQPILAEADLVLGNLETKLAGKETGYTGYPMFNAPDSLAFALKKAGITFLSTANNHCLDRRKAGIIKTNETLDWAGILHSGTFTSQADRDAVCILKKNNLSLTVLAYTYGTNGMPFSKKEQYLVNLIDEKQMAVDISRARNAGVDFVVCFLHFGDEYQRQPNKQQIQLVKYLFDQGADIVLASHPHVVQPYQVLTASQPHKVVVYSMGNFLANQLKRYTNLGVIFKLTLTKSLFEEKRVVEVETIPTRTVTIIRNNRYTFRVLPLKRVLENKTQYDLPPQLLPELEKDLAEMDKHLRSMTA